MTSNVLNYVNMMKMIGSNSLDRNSKMEYLEELWNKMTYDEQYYVRVILDVNKSKIPHR